MGLDMYLTAKKYLTGHDEADKKIQDEMLKLDIKGLGNRRVKYITSEVAYWRKANQIHQWFVTNCQDGVDECEESYVSMDDLITLVELCKIVLENNSLAVKLLPPSRGCFFGSDEIDEYYFTELKDTVKMLEEFLNTFDIEDWDIYYKSSW